MLIGESSSVWKTHNTEDCKSKEYYAKKINSTSTSNYKAKSDSNKNYSRSKERKQSMRREIKRALKRRDAGYSSSDSDGSKAE